MQSSLRATLAALVTASLVLVVLAAGATAAPRHHHVRLPGDYYAWSKVAKCEEGGWIAGYSWYGTSTRPPGGYTVAGISAVNWLHYGRIVLGIAPQLPPPGPVPLATQIIAIRIGDYIEPGSYVPDQGGCAAW